MSKNANDKLLAVSSVDGRYRTKLGELSHCVSEAALINYRLKVEAHWLLHLADQPAIALKLPAAIKTELQNIIHQGCDEQVASEVKKIEDQTNHDVKAVEYYLRARLKKGGADDKVLAFVHFACTSEDINNIAYAMMLRDVRKDYLLPNWHYILEELSEKARDNAELAMLSRTHGQAATPTTLGKELAVFGKRLLRYRNQLEKLQLEAKINGAVGNYNAHMIAFPKINWPLVAQTFVEKRLGLKLNTHTTQIESHDTLIEYVDIVKRFNTVLLGLCRDIWSYISIGYFSQFMRKDEVGSSTMPHKVNPIDFENAEGNLGIANALAVHFSDKLLISRWQRDLSDSTVMRALGTFFGHCVLSYHSCLRGLAKITPVKDLIAKDLSDNWGVLAEAVQTVMRKHGVGDAYERLKDQTRGRPVTKDILAAVIDQCKELPDAVKAELKALQPKNYLGLATTLANAYCQELAEVLHD